MIDRLADAGFPVKVCCRVLGVSSPGYYRYRNRTVSPTELRRQWLTELIREIHVASRGTYGSRRIHAELTGRMGIRVSERLVAALMRKAGIRGIPARVRIGRLRAIGETEQLMNRKFPARPNPGSARRLAG